MSSYSSEELSVFDTVEEERDYWNKSCLSAEKYDQQLMACHDYEEKEDWVEIPRKRARIEDAVPTDPLKLPEPCFQAIIKYLNGKELLKCQEVNKTWKKYVESCKILMDRSMKEVCVTPTIKGYSLSQIDELFNNDTKRNYKHMKAPFILHNEITIKIVVHPFKRYASTLETLTITDEFKIGDNEILENVRNPCIFLKLKNLMIEKQITLSFVENFSFPELTNLTFIINQDIDSNSDNENYDDDYDVLKEFLLKCPKLKFLSLKYESDEREYAEIDPIEFPLELDPNQPKIQSITINYYPARFLREQKYSLVSLTLHELFATEMSWILRDLKMLETLEVYHLLHGDDAYGEIFEENNSIKKFTLFDVTDFLRDIADQDQFNILMVQRMLRSLRSLVDLSLHDDKTGEMVNFVASNMVNLKKFSCKNSCESSQLAYQHIKDNPNEYINSTFEYIIRQQ